MSSFMNIRLLNLMSKFDSSGSVPTSGQVPTWDPAFSAYIPKSPGGSTPVIASPSWFQKNKVMYLPYGKKMLPFGGINMSSLWSYNPGFQLMYRGSDNLDKMYLLANMTTSYVGTINMWVYTVDPNTGLPGERLFNMPAVGASSSTVYLGDYVCTGFPFSMNSTDMPLGWFWLCAEFTPGVSSSAEIFLTHPNESFSSLYGTVLDSGGGSTIHGLEETTGATLSSYPSSLVDNLALSSSPTARIAVAMTAG